MPTRAWADATAPWGAWWRRVLPLAPAHDVKAVVDHSRAVAYGLGRGVRLWRGLTGKLPWVGALRCFGLLAAAAALGAGAVLCAAAEMGCSESSCGWWESLLPAGFLVCAIGAVVAAVAAARLLVRGE